MGSEMCIRDRSIGFQQQQANGAQQQQANGAPTPCPRCKVLNDHMAQWCQSCGLRLTDDNKKLFSNVGNAQAPHAPQLVAHVNGKAKGEGKNKDAGKSGGKNQAAPIMHPPATDPNPKSQDLPTWDKVKIAEAWCIFLGGRFSQSKCTCNIAWNFTGAAKTFQHCRN